MTAKDYPKSGVRTPEAKARREAHWRGVLDRWRATGLAKTEFARREQISPDVLGWWQAQIQKRDLGKRRKLSGGRAGGGRWKPAPKPSAFVPVRVVEPSPAPPAAPIEVLAGGYTVRVGPGFDAETLWRLVRVLEGRP